MKDKHNQKILAKKLCRELRKNQTKIESIFWEAVRNRKFRNLKFNRQYPVFFDYYGKLRFFIADFYCYEYSLVVEIDGKIHDYQKEHDFYRTYIMNNYNT